MMECSICGLNLQKVSGDYPFETKQLGTITIPSVARYHCPKCNETFLPPMSAENVFQYVNKQIAKKIALLPIGSFLSLAGAADLLGVSKQAFTQNKRIERGFIYSYLLDGRLYYLAESVLAFKATGDGRIPLNSLDVPESVTRKAADLFFDILKEQWNMFPKSSSKKRKLGDTSVMTGSKNEGRPVKYLSSKVNTLTLSTVH